MLLIVAPKERKVRIEVGRGLEPQLTDIMTKLIIQNAILPAFRRGDFAAGIKAGVRDIRDVMLGDAEAVKERARRTVKRDPDARSALFGFAIFVHVRRLHDLGAMAAEQISTAGRGSGAMRGGSARAMTTASSSFPAAGAAASGGGGGGGGGGGWSGGGGDFGGGGSSGSW